MPIDHEALLSAALTDVPFSYTEHDAILYALGIGCGSDPVDPAQLPYVSEHAGLQTLPTFAGMFIPDSIVVAAGIDQANMLHRSEVLQLFRPLPGSADLLANQRVIALTDRGAKRGADLELETELRLAKDDAVVCTIRTRIIARNDGGFGGVASTTRERHRLPDRDPDLVCDLPTRPDQALLFRLSGDFNPLHADPAIAHRAGFERPILHGRCTFGIACHAVLRTVCNYDFTLIREIAGRFSSPVYPGDTITTEMWQDGNVVSFRCKVLERGVTVINNGRVTLQT
jgi:acyl dehydratase